MAANDPKRVLDAPILQIAALFFALSTGLHGIVVASGGSALAQSNGAQRCGFLECQAVRTVVPSLNPVDPDDAIRSFVQDIYLSDRETYADTVDYFDSGLVSRAAVLADRNAYRQKWPVRDYRLVPDTLVWSRVNLKIVSVEYDFTYRVQNGTRKSSGTGRSKLLLRLENDRYVVVSAKEVALTK